MHDMNSRKRCNIDQVSWAFHLKSEAFGDTEMMQDMK